MALRAGNTTRSWPDLLLIAAFVAAIYLPIAEGILQLDRTTAPEEKRSLARFPHVTLAATCLAGLPPKLEAWYDDHFGFRNRLIRAHNWAKVMWLHASPSPKVVVGRDGLYYLADEETAAQSELASDQLLRQWQQALEEKRDWLAAKGIAFLVVIAPDKQSIYPEKLPRAVAGQLLSVRTEQFVQHMAAHSQVEIVYPRRPLLEAKKESPVYYRTDTHWTAFGSYVVYREIMARLSEQLAEVKPLSLSEFDRLGKMLQGGDLATMLGVEDAVREERTWLIRRRPPGAPELRLPNPEPPPGTGAAIRIGEQSAADLPRLVMFHDSFGLRLMRFLSEHFSRSVYVEARDVKRLTVEWEQPDVVILEVCERYLARRDAFTSNPAMQQDLEAWQAGKRPRRESGSSAALRRTLPPTRLGVRAPGHAAGSAPLGAGRGRASALSR
jgi:hypothetical protein